ncbi:MAG: hypothetical protein DRP06_03585 [Candidatus Aenigmatarchaeota archaeon]|nr:MAG: hypothetical protein DRP06_03585 [Candidatus Aenigmarchaeota archaeon]
MIIIASYTIYSYQAICSYKINTEISITNDALKKISENSKFVFNQKKPAKHTITICLPESITNCSINNTILSCYLGDKLIEHTSEVNLTGWIPNISGCHEIKLVAENDYVDLIKPD